MYKATLLKVTFALLGLMGSSLLWANAGEAPPSNHYLGAAVNWLQLDEDRETKDHASGLGVYYGYRLTHRVWWETEGSIYRQPTHLGASFSYHQYHLATGLAYAFGDRTGWTPYIIGQIGMIRHEVLPSQDNDTNFSANAGVGIVSPSLFSNGMKMRADVRHVYDEFDGDRATQSDGKGGFNDWRFSLGVEFPLGTTKIVTRTKEVVKTRTERVEVEVEKPFIDSDGDGVPDDRDDCPDTIPGAKVDARGCIIPDQSIVLKDILFEFNSSKLTPASERSLGPVAASLQKHDDVKIEVAGYSDNLGNADYNRNLSQQRAESVREFLIKNGVNASSLTAKGYGPQDPIASNDTETGRALNRRVELHFVKK